MEDFTMGMVVRSNIMAINAHRQLNMNNSQVSKSLEKLSSGYRINRAGDDAAGLAISEKMKAQIKGLETASLNCQDGISLIQTAEGALTEVHDMLNRMVELAGRSANGTMSTIDRQALQSEVTQLNAEITRIAGSTNFNKINLLDGSLNITLQIGDTASQVLTVTIANAMDAATLGVDGIDVAGGDSGAIDTIRSAINTVSTTRGYLGALQNRVEHTINNLDVTTENMKSANSRIRDTDMAKMMMEYTQTNVITQAAQAMLAQANQQPQGVLQLLQ
jgi:flagellin